MADAIDPDTETNLDAAGVFSAHLRELSRVAAAMPTLVTRVRDVAELLRRAFGHSAILYTFGNGGSAADAQHFTGELIGRYRRDRPPLPAVTLSTDPTVLTCTANDYSYDDVFARQVQALVRPGDVVAAFTTSGLSRNVVSALSIARARGATTVLFGGADGGPALAYADHALLVPSTQTPRIQEMHTVLLHAISDWLDAWAAGNPGGDHG